MYKTHHRNNSKSGGHFEFHADRKRNTCPVIVGTKKLFETDFYVDEFGNLHKAEVVDRVFGKPKIKS
ncbi:MAG: hypothetical protein JST87_05440 [Bacteroidetes bacterium]|nr:hypothetical protein [Bacteroidota bacterium]